MKRAPLNVLVALELLAVAACGDRSALLLASPPDATSASHPATDSGMPAPSCGTPPACGPGQTCSAVTLDVSQTVRQPEGPTAIVSGAFHGGCVLDLAVADPESVRIYPGRGDGTFGAPTRIAVSEPNSLVTGDFNGDGRLDLAIAVIGDDSISVDLGRGDGTFEPAMEMPLENEPYSLVTADFNGDGRLDVAVGYTASAIGAGMYLGNGDGTFTYLGDFLEQDESFSWAVGDFNGDGHVDLAYVGTYLGVLLGHGDGTLGAPILADVFEVPDSEAFGIVVGDFNGDGRLDLAASGANSSTNAASVVALLGNGDGTFRTGAAVQVAGSSVTGPFSTLPGGIVAGDFNHDCHLDVAVAIESNNEVVWLQGGGDGSFRTGGHVALTNFPFTIAQGDFDGDGRVDMGVLSAGFNPMTGESSPGGADAFVVLGGCVR